MFDNMTIKSRLMLVIGMLSVLLVGIGSLGLYGISQSNAGLKTVYEDRTVVLADLSQILDQMQIVRMNAVMAANLNSIEVARQRTAMTAERDAGINTIWQKFMATYLVPEEEKLANTFARQWPAYQESRDRTMSLAMAGNFEAAVANATSDAGAKFDVAHATMLGLIELQGRVAAQEYAEAQSNFNTVFMITSVAVAVGVILAVVIGMMLIRAIVGPINEAVDVANAVASGDLTSRIDVTSNNETGRLMQALRLMNDNLVDLVGKVRTSTDSIYTASSEIASGKIGRAHV